MQSTLLAMTLATALALFKAASMTTPSGSTVGSDFNSCISATRAIIYSTGRCSCRPWRNFYHNRIAAPVFENQAVALSSCLLFGVGAGLSILLIATMMGTPAASRGLMASMVGA